ncbi:MAG: HTH domain-containing protein [Bacteroidota bacterium]
MKEKEKPRLSRLSAIMTQLRFSKIFTCKYLAEKNNVSTRTIYRDICTLEQFGIPEKTEEGRVFSIIKIFGIG